MLAHLRNNQSPDVRHKELLGRCLLFIGEAKHAGRLKRHLSPRAHALCVAGGLVQQSPSTDGCTKLPFCWYNQISVAGYLPDHKPALLSLSCEQDNA